MRAKPIQHEAIEQRALIQWAQLQSTVRPALVLLFAVPNGGRRDRLTAQLMKAEGVKAGVPDLVLPVARHGYHGLFIEMKAESGRLSPLQKDWHWRLRDEGYAVTTCYGWLEAKAQILDYLEGEPFFDDKRFDHRRGKSNGGNAKDAL